MPTAKSSSLEQIELTFNRILGTAFEVPPGLRNEFRDVTDKLGVSPKPSDKELARCLIQMVNAKFEFNRQRIQSFLTSAANLGVTFNYHEKREIASIHNGGTLKTLRHFLAHARRGTISPSHQRAISALFEPLEPQQTIALLHRELKNPTLVRKDSQPRDWSEEILTSLFAGFMYCRFEAKSLHGLNDPLAPGQDYEPDFWQHLHRNLPTLFSRDLTLCVLFVPASEATQDNEIVALRQRVQTYVANAHGRLANHGYLAVVLEGGVAGHEHIQWLLFSDIVLYGEKHIQSVVSQYYFRSKEIAEATSAYIPGLKEGKGEFSKLARGFIYQDCFVLGEGSEQRLMLLLQKNVADETLIPCPACRSHEVQGNSYSSLGVRSWECQSQLCPDRTKFNRGKRYSFLQLLKQRAIQDERNDIPPDSVKKWMRDVQPARSDEEIIEMLLRHYTLFGDGVEIAGRGFSFKSLGRRISFVSGDVEWMLSADQEVLRPADFYESAYFKRFAIKRSPDRSSTHPRVAVAGVEAICGDAFEVLHSLRANSIDGAVTSPPYYNAREYSQWANIYTYLYDMYNINAAVYRVLKPGALYLFNIFDYFDNENNVSLSAMGNKRMILGAYIIDLFRRVGFQIVGNAVWDKGSIEGKRGFNNGNNSSYYQAPFNCWEHIFVFQKHGKANAAAAAIPNLLRQKPVIKMVGGYNTHGHSAPFPEAIPMLLTSTLNRGSLVLDPFGGSMTTGIAALKAGMRSICIEKDAAYFKLGVAKLKQAIRQPSLL